jgi:ribonuclease PH
VDLRLIGERTLNVDCDVIQADGGTRTAAITGAYVAVAIALDKMIRAKEASPRALKTAVAAVSVGLVGGEPLLDLNYAEDSRAEVDFNVVMTAEGNFVEVQGTGEGATFSLAQMLKLLDLAGAGIKSLLALQAAAIERARA